VVKKRNQKEDKIMKKIFLAFLMAFAMCSCVSETAKQTLEHYNDVYVKVDEIETMMQYTDLETLSAEDLVDLYDIAKELSYTFNPMDLKPEQIAACELLKQRVIKVRSELLDQTERIIKKYRVHAWEYADKLMEETQTFPVYMLRGEKLYWNIKAQKPIGVKIYNSDSRQLIKSYTGKSICSDSLAIQNTAIYLVEVSPNGSQYFDMDISYKSNDVQRLKMVTPVKAEAIECGANDFRAKKIPGISMVKCFEEPRKFTLRSQLKSAFSGSSTALVAVQVPEGATDILYSMRISTSESDRYSDGQFHDNLGSTYKKIKFMGLPIYERTKGTGIIASLLDDNKPYREEEAYCSMYVFRSKAVAKQFQDGTKPASQLAYDVDYSTVGPQSCNGRIPVNGSKTIYLAFENERVRYSNYLWVEVEAVKPGSIYYTTKYTLK
jgi:hypothetical protein